MNSLDECGIAGFAKSGLFAVGWKEGIGDAVGEVEGVQEMGDFRGEFGDEVMGGEGGHFPGGALVGVGGVIEAVWVVGHGDESGCGGAGKVADGRGAAAGVRAIHQGVGKGVEEACGGIGRRGGLVARVFAEGRRGGEMGEAAGGVADEFRSVVAAVSAAAVFPFSGHLGGREGHVEAGFGEGNGEGGRTEAAFHLKPFIL